MATLLLQATGAYLGGLFGATGATIGAAAGALGGYLVDQALINGSRHIKGARLGQMQPLSGEDGAPLARVYGTVRTGGAVIWVTRFEEASRTERRGAKGGPKVTSYSYYANFAVAICEGEISHVRRIWADGRELDQTEFEIRIHKGAAGQLPDPLLEAKQGAGNAPAYRGTAYAVFDCFPLADFGNRIPQVQFEVVRTAGGLAGDIRAVTIIPGSTEFGYAPSPVIQSVREGETIIPNRSNKRAQSDWSASLDELQALCPNLESVALVVAWFGDDLRAGVCDIRPGVVSAAGLQGDLWQVSGIGRAGARVMSDTNGRKAYGGRPDDASVVAAIRDLKARGLKVMLYPFVMMDIAQGNTLASPYGGSTQEAYPWRGMVTCHPAPAMAGTVDATMAAAGQVAAFCGTAAPAMFGWNGAQVTVAPEADWKYRRMILHCAALAQAAGGVDGFLIGSEMKGLTRVRSAKHTYPFVSELKLLAADVRAMLGAGTKLTYAADWSEYGAYAPPGTSDLDFNLDPLWADPAIDAVGIDNYMPLSDWRDEDVQAPNRDGAECATDKAAFRRGIDSGEGFDWQYATAQDRTAGLRTEIADGLSGKHWVWRNKDIKAWWQNPHFNRDNGVESATATQWQPSSKPVWFTELGCPAVDKAGNQPNVFADAKSSQSALPWFSNGGRDDLVQHRFLAAHAEHWSDPVKNPVSPVYGLPMVDTAMTHVWCWDARPFPEFPLDTGIWGDGENWLTGHWLNGRLAGVTLDTLTAAILQENGIDSFDCGRADGFLQGFALEGQTTVREALDRLLQVFQVSVSEQAGRLTLVSNDRLRGPSLPVEPTFAKDDRLSAARFADLSELPVEMSLQFRDAMREFQAESVVSAMAGVAGPAQSIELPVVWDSGDAGARLRVLHRAVSAGREAISFETGWKSAALTPGDMISDPLSGTGTFRIRAITDGISRVIDAERVVLAARPPARSSLPGTRVVSQDTSGRPWIAFADLPQMEAAASGDAGLHVAAWSKPWTPVAIYSSPEQDGFRLRTTLAMPAMAGALLTGLSPGNAGRIDAGGIIDVALFGGALQSRSMLQLLNGANAVAIQAATGEWEIVQFLTAAEIAPNHWRLGGLLRGQLGTGDAMAAGAQSGARLIVLDEAFASANLAESELELTMNWRCGPAGRDLTSRHFLQVSTPPARRSSLSYAPCHMAMRQLPSGDLACSWIRRARQGGDSWDAVDVPLPEGVERYRLRVFDLSGAQIRSVETSTAAWIYPAALSLADFGSGAHGGALDVCQLGADGMPGLSVTGAFTINN